jgi:hypothetical protein
MQETRLKVKYPLLHWYIQNDAEDPFPLALYNRQRDILQAGEAITPYGNMFLSSMLHDSWVLSIRESGGQLTIELSDFSTRCLCHAIYDVCGKKQDSKSFVMPLTLTFDGVSLCVLNRVNRNVKVLPIRKDKYVPAISEYLYDEVTQLDEAGVALGIVFWRRSSRLMQVILEVEAQRLRIQEQFRAAFLSTVGNDYESLFDAYLTQRSNGKSLDYSSALEFLKSEGVPVLRELENRSC